MRFPTSHVRENMPTRIILPTIITGWWLMDSSTQASLCDLSIEFTVQTSINKITIGPGWSSSRREVEVGVGLRLLHSRNLELVVISTR